MQKKVERGHHHKVPAKHADGNLTFGVTGSTSHPKALKPHKKGIRHYPMGSVKPKKAIFGVSQPPMQQVSPKFAKVKVKVVKAKNEDKKKKTINRKRGRMGNMQVGETSRTWRPFMM
jgi:hypothetical protein